MDFGTATNIALTAYVAGTSIVGSLALAKMLVTAFKKKDAGKGPLITVPDYTDSRPIDTAGVPHSGLPMTLGGAAMFDSLPEITALLAKIDTLRSKFKEAEITKFANATTPQELAAKAIALKNMDYHVQEMVEDELRENFIKSLPDNIIAHIINTGENVFNLAELHMFSFHPNAEMLGNNKTVAALTGKCVFRLNGPERNRLAMQLHREGFAMKYNMDDFSITVTPNIQ